MADTSLTIHNHNFLEIKPRNHKAEAASIRVAEHLYRWSNWSVAESSDPYRKTDSLTGCHLSRALLVVDL